MEMLVKSRPGSIGTPAFASNAFAASLSPIDAMTSGEGPTHVSPASITAWAKEAFSLRKP